MNFQDYFSKPWERDNFDKRRILLSIHLYNTEDGIQIDVLCAQMYTESSHVFINVKFRKKHPSREYPVFQSNWECFIFFLLSRQCYCSFICIKICNLLLLLSLDYINKFLLAVFLLHNVCSLWCRDNSYNSPFPPRLSILPGIG